MNNSWTVNVDVTAVKTNFEITFDTPDRLKEGTTRVYKTGDTLKIPQNVLDEAINRGYKINEEILVTLELQYDSSINEIPNIIIDNVLKECTVEPCKPIFALVEKIKASGGGYKGHKRDRSGKKVSDDMGGGITQLD